MAELEGGATVEWVEIIEPTSHDRMFANPTTGEIVLTPPAGVTVKPMSQNQWWELYDQESDKNYYYNAHTLETVWNKPGEDADIISLTKLQSPPEGEEGEGVMSQQPVPAVGVEETDHVGNSTPYPDQQNGDHHQSEATSSSIRKTSDIFSGDLESLSPLDVDFPLLDQHMRGGSPNLRPPSSTSGTNSYTPTSLPNSQDCSDQYSSEGLTAEGIGGRGSREGHRDYGASPTNGERSGSELYKRGRSPLLVSTSPQRGPSPTQPDGLLHITAENRADGDGTRDRRAGSLEPPDKDEFTVQGMSYEQKARTLDLQPSKQRKKNREQAKDRPTSGPTPPPSGIRAKDRPTSGPTPPPSGIRAYSPSHPAPKIPPQTEPKPSSLRRRAQKQRSVDMPDSEILSAKSHSRAKSDIPPAPPLFKSPQRAGSLQKGAASIEPLESFKDLSQHRRGFFRKKVTIANMLQWTKEPIKRPMVLTREKQLRKEACDLFKLVLQFMGDRRTKQKNPDMIALDITTRCWEKKGLRDEIYVQLCRQTSANGNKKSLERGWQLFAICLAFFPPTIKFRSYLEGYIWRHVEPLPDFKGVPIEVYAQYCHKRVEKMTQTGAKKGVKKPSIEEVMHAKVAPFHPSMFGGTLEEIMELQLEKFPDYRIPWVVVALSDVVMQLCGPTTEGIFRVPGDIDEVNSLKLQVEKGELPVSPLRDPHIPASLLKLWFRELEEPLIPEEYYQECIDNCDNRGNAISLIGSLPDLNREVLIYLVKFLKKFITPEHIEATKMGLENLSMVWAPNFLRCPSEDHALIFQNTRKEMAFLRLLLKYLQTDPNDRPSLSSEASDTPSPCSP